MKNRDVIRRIQRLTPYLQNPKWRTGISLMVGFCVNTGIAIFHLITGLIFRSLWLYAVAIYYIVLSLMRAKLIQAVRLMSEQEMGMGWERASGIKSYRLCGVMMFSLEAVMSGIVVQIVRQNHSYEYPGALIYLSALYAFYCLITAVTRVAGSKRTDPPELAAAGLLSVSKSLMSLLSLQTALLARFGDNEAFRQVMNAVTGCGVCLIVLGIAFYMVIRAGRELKQISGGETFPSDKSEERAADSKQQMEGDGVKMEDKKRQIEWKFCLRIGISVFLLFLGMTYWSTAAGLLAALFQAILPILLGGAIAYLVNILMSFYERHYFPRRSGKTIAAKTRRPVCMIGAVLTIVAVAVLVIGLVVPEFVSCVNTLIQKAPEAVNTLLEYPIIADLIPDDVASELSGLDWKAVISKVTEVFEYGLAGAVGTVSSVVTGFITGLFSVFFAVYILLGKDKIRRQCSRLMKNYLRPSWRERIARALSLLDQCFHKYIVGQCLEAVILGGLCALGMTLFRFPYALMIGALVGLTALIPVAGAYIGAAVGAFMILAVSPEQAILFLIFIFILQQLEGNLIYPKVVGSSIGLPGILVLAAVTVGGALFGVIGMFVSVPVTAAVYSAVRSDMEKRERKESAMI